LKESGLTRKLHDLLHREAHLKLCRTHTTPQWTKMEAELRAMQATKPRFMALISRKRREEYHTNLYRTQKAVEQLRHRMQMLDLCEPHIAKMIEEEVEKALRDECPEYIQALAALRQKEDWLRCLERFGGKIFEFTRALGNVRNLACSGYARQSNVYSTAALQAFTLAYEAGQAVEEEVKFANRIAETQVGTLRSYGVVTRSLPRLPETSFSEWVNKIKALPLAEAQLQFDSLIETTKKLHASGIPELKTQADQVEQTQDGDIKNFLYAAWEQFRVEVAPEIFPGDTERSVASTEEMLNTAARTSVTGRL
jgi:hypothetical protein